MMFEMIEIIANQVFERGRVGLVDCLEGNLIKRVLGSLLRENGFGNKGNNAHEMQVVGPPETDQVAPVFVVVLLRVDPLVAVVTRKCKILGELRAHKTLVIVGGGVDQVAEDLLRTPLLGRTLGGGF